VSVRECEGVDGRESIVDHRPSNQRISAWPDLGPLGSAFERFSEAAAILEDQQRALQSRIAALDIELAEANDHLAESLDAQSRLANGLHNVLENLTTGVIAVDTEGVITTVNSAALTLLGCGSEEDLLRRPVSEAVGERLDCSAVAEMATGGWFPERTVEVRCAAPDPPAPFRMGEGGAESTSQRINESTPARHLRLRGSAARDVETGQSIGGILLIEDITALVTWRERALLNERLSTMGQVAAQVAHEIRNPLGSIELLTSALAQETCGNGGRGAELAGHIVASVRTLDSLISNILLFARGREPEVAPVTWEEIARAAVHQVEHAVASAKIHVERRWQAHPLTVLGDAELLTQALVNLLINATQALADMSGRRAITVETGGDSASAWIRVADTGPGVPEDLRHRIFDPFVTTRRRGTGLGLAIVSHIVGAHGGAIRCGEAPGGGAVFEITLPRAEAAAISRREGTHG
jgi:nitrogen fixation/metabolism regulation signal transduction histidine kinase